MLRVRLQLTLVLLTQNLLKMTYERDQALSNNKSLQTELDTYKSVAVPLESKPRTNFTRVGRPAPLASRDLNGGGFSKSVGHELRPTSIHKPVVVAPTLEELSVLEYKEGDLTLDELSVY